MTLAIIPKPLPKPDFDALIQAYWLMFLCAPARPTPEPDGFYSLGEIGEAPEKSWTKATPYSIARQAK